MIVSDFQQITWNKQVEDDCLDLVRLAVREDLARSYDWTTLALVPEDAQGSAAVVPRKPGIIAGLPAAQLALNEMDRRLQWTPLVADGSPVVPGQHVATISGSARSLLTCERLALNLISRLSGVATLTKQYVDLLAGTAARIYDTRKTTPGWRRLEKYAVRAGGGWNHRLGLYDALLIKDNHLAFGAEGGGAGYSPAEAVAKARRLVAQFDPPTDGAAWIIEIEVETLEQLDQVLPESPDIVLLDNMSLADLCQAVERRNVLSPQVQLEASGGVSLDTVAEIARTGVDRISVGALTHSAICFDVGLDWL